eukprot:tig00000788_g4079.t1
MRGAAGPAPRSIPARFARDGRPRLEGVALGLPASPIGAYGALLLAVGAPAAPRVDPDRLVTVVDGEGRPVPALCSAAPAEHLLGAAVAGLERPFSFPPSPITLRLDAGGDGGTTAWTLRVERGAEPLRALREAAAGRVGAPAAGLRLRGPCGAALDSDRDVWALRDGDLVSC